MIEPVDPEDRSGRAIFITVPQLAPGLFRSAERLQQQVSQVFRTPDSVVRLREQFAASLAPIFRRQNDIAMRMDELLAPFTEAVREWQRTVVPGMARLGRVVRESWPPNWPDGVGLSPVIDLIEETRWALVWVPDAKVVSALLEADDDDSRGKVLLDHADMIVDAVRRRVAEVDDPELLYCADVVREAADTLASGYERASQSLCSTVLTELLETKMGYRKLAKASKELSAQNWEDSRIPFVRFALIASTIPLTLTNFTRDMPEIFNRHASAHRANPVQFTTLNALSGLILVAALVRELDELERRGLFGDGPE